jgi:hypothetical protein
MILSVLLPVWGAWLNPSFAGQMPQHDHLHFGDYDSDHHHRLETHRHTKPEKEAPLERYASLLSSIVNMPDLDTSLQGLSFLVFAADLLALRLPDARYSLAGDEILAGCGITVYPLESPPRL